MQNKLKKIVSNLLLASFAGSSIIACSNDSNTSSGPSTPSLTASGKSASSNDSFDGLWANVVNYDSLDQDSNLDLVPNNDSSANVTFLGCDNDKAYALNAESVMDFSAGYQFPTTTNYADKWIGSFPLQPDGKKSPIYSSAAIFNHAIHFSGAGQSGHANCYFKLDNPSLNAPLFVKLANNWKSQCSDNQTCGSTVRDYIPNLLQEKESRDAWWFSQQVLEGVSVSVGAMAGYAKYLRSEIKYSPDMGQYLDIRYTDMMDGYVNSLNNAFKQFEDFSLTDARWNTPEVWTLEQKAAFNELKREFFYTNNGFFNTSAIGASDLQIDRYMGRLIAEFKNVAIREDYDDSLGFGFQYRELEASPENIAWLDEPAERYAFQTEYQVYQNTLELPSVEMGNIGIATSKNSIATVLEFDETATRASTEISRRILFAKNQEIADGLSDRALLKFEKEAMNFNKVAGDVAVRSVVKGGLVMIGIAAASDFLLTSFGKWAGGEPSIGIYDTTINKISFAAVTASDAASWNKSHPNNQINANTSFTTIGAPDAVNQVVMLSSIDSNVDGQYAITMSLQALSTPFERYEEYSKDSCMQDPFLGTIGKSDCSGKTHKSDGVMVWHISDNVGDQLQDIDFERTKQTGSDYGVKELSSLSPLDAPAYQISSIMGADRQSLPLSTMLAKAKQLLLPKKGINSKVLNDNLEGLVFNHNQTVKMRVTLPAASAKNDAQENLISGGLWTKLVLNKDDIGTGDITESTAYYFHVVDSMSSYVDNSSTIESGLDTVFSHRFNCRFPIKPGSSCDLTMKLTGHNDGKKHIANLLLADKTSYTTYIPVYINYNLISKTNQIEIDAGDAYPHGVSFKNVSGKTYQQLGMNGLPKGATVSYQPSGCNTNLASGSECMINFNLKNVNVDGDTEDFLMNIYGIDAGNVGKPFELIPDMDRLPLKITINNSDWAAAKTKKAASVGK